MKRNKIHWRSFTSFIIAAFFLIITISGIFLYFAPPGRVAYWTDWRFIGYTKTQWQAIHTIFSFLFVIAAGFHIFFNWSILVSYLKKKLSEKRKRQRELSLALALTVIVFVLTVFDIPPFGTVMSWGEDLSNSWASEKNEPPIPHAELLTLAELAEVSKLDVKDVMTRLTKNGIIPDSDTMIVKDLAEKYDLTPKELFDKIKISGDGKNVSESRSFPLKEGYGYGRMTIAQISEKNQLKTEDVLKRLQAKNIICNENDNIRDVAKAHDMLPIDLVKIMTGEKQMTQ